MTDLMQDFEQFLKNKQLTLTFKDGIFRLEGQGFSIESPDFEWISSVQREME